MNVTKYSFDTYLKRFPLDDIRNKTVRFICRNERGAGFELVAHERGGE